MSEREEGWSLPADQRWRYVAVRVKADEAFASGPDRVSTAQRAVAIVNDEFLAQHPGNEEGVALANEYRRQAYVWVAGIAEGAMGVADHAIRAKALTDLAHLYTRSFPNTEFASTAQLKVAYHLRQTADEMTSPDPMRIQLFAAALRCYAEARQHHPNRALDPFLTERTAEVIQLIAAEQRGLPPPAGAAGLGE